MKITEISQALNNSLPENKVTNFTNQQDVLQFNEALSNKSDITSNSSIMSSHPLKHLASLEADYVRKLQHLSTSLNPGDYMKTARSLSAYQLESLVTVKVISKTTQAIEKLTNLQ